MEYIENLSEKEKQKMRKYEKKLYATSGKETLEYHESFLLAAKFFPKYFGYTYQEGESSEITKERNNIISYMYKKAVKDKKIPVIIQMEIWCKKWEEYCKDELKEASWLASQILAGNITYEDAALGKCISPYKKTELIIQIPLSEEQLKIILK